MPLLLFSSTPPPRLRHLDRRRSRSGETPALCLCFCRCFCSPPPSPHNCVISIGGAAEVERPPHLPLYRHPHRSVISTGAQRSEGTPAFAFVPAPTTEASSRPERSGVERPPHLPLLLPSSVLLPHPKTVILSGAQRSRRTCTTLNSSRSSTPFSHKTRVPYPLQASSQRMGHSRTRPNAPSYLAATQP